MSLLKKSKVFEFSPITKKSFKYFKEYFTIEFILYKANPVLPYILELDTSSVIIFDILFLKNPNTKELYSITYYFKKFSPAELNYII